MNSSTVYADDEGILRTEHTISFLGLTIIHLHYKMSLAPGPRKHQHCCAISHRSPAISLSDDRVEIK
jgi:hypothetical protein